jgi:hypothetical protein
VRFFNHAQKCVKKPIFYIVIRPHGILDLIDSMKWYRKVNILKLKGYIWFNVFITYSVSQLHKQRAIFNSFYMRVIKKYVDIVALLQIICKKFKVNTSAYYMWKHLFRIDNFKFIESMNVWIFIAKPCTWSRETDVIYFKNSHVISPWSKGNVHNGIFQFLKILPI